MRALMLMVGLVVATPAMTTTAKRHSPAVGVLSDARRSVSERMKDPGSAQFRNVRKATDADRPRVCGQVNAKNSYGGYTGFQNFVYFTDTKESEVFDGDPVSAEYVHEKARLFGSCFR